MTRPEFQRGKNSDQPLKKDSSFHCNFLSFITAINKRCKNIGHIQFINWYCSDVPAGKKSNKNDHPANSL